MDNNDLSRIIAMAKQGDRKAFGTLYTRFYDTIYRFVLKKIKNKETAEDITQEVFMQSFEGIDSLKEPEKYLSWLYSIASHKCADHFRLQSKDQKAVEESAASSQRSAFSKDCIMLPDDYCESAENAQKLREMIDALKPDMKKALLLYYYDELSISKVAKKMGSNENAVKQKLYRARKRLGAEIKKLEKNGAAFSLVPMREFMRSAFEDKAAAKPRSLKSAQAKTAVAGAAIACSLAVSVPIGLYFTEHRIEENNNDISIVKTDSNTDDDSSDTEFVKIPDLVDLSVQEAQERLAEIGLKSEIRKTE